MSSISSPKTTREREAEINWISEKKRKENKQGTGRKRTVYDE